MTANQRQLFGLILAGGHSTRMGKDKALLNYHGRSQLEHTYKLLAPYCEQIFISIRPDQQAIIPYSYYQQLLDLPEWSNVGPLGGIATALTKSPDKAWLVIACDLPFVTTETLTTLINNRDKTKIATAFKNIPNGLPEPLCAIWESKALSSIQQLFNEGITCPRKVLIKSSTRLLDQANPQWLNNVNTAEELAGIKDLLKDL